MFEKVKVASLSVTFCYNYQAQQNCCTVQVTRGYTKISSPKRPLRSTSPMLYRLNYKVKLGIIIDSSEITRSKIFFAKFLSLRSKPNNYSCCCSTGECTRVGAKNYLLFLFSPQTKNVSLSFGYCCLCW